VKAILLRVAYGVIAVAALAACAGVMVVTAAMTLYALVLAPLGPVGAAAVVFGAAAVLMGALGLTCALLAKGPKKKAPVAPEGDLLSRLMGLAKDKPIVSVGALIAAATVAIRNPAVVGIVVKALLDTAKPRTTTGKKPKP
jgi:hypothetical protein